MKANDDRKKRWERERERESLLDAMFYIDVEIGFSTWKWEKFSQASHNIFYVVSFSFGIYQLEQNLYDKLFAENERRQKKKRAKKCLQEKFLKLNEDLSMEYILITFWNHFYF